MKKFVKKFLLLFFFFFFGLFLLIFSLKLVNLKEVKKSFSLLKGSDLMVIFILTFLIIFLSAYKWKKILEGLGQNLPFLKIFSLYLSGFSLSYLVSPILFANESLRSYLLKRKEKIPFSLGIFSIVLERIFEWLVNLVLIFLGIFLFFFLKKKLDEIIFLLFFFLLSLIIFFFVFKNILKIFKKRMVLLIKNFWLFLNLKNKEIKKALALTFLRGFFSFLRIFFFLKVLVKISFLKALSITGFYYLSFIIPIPAALGIQEVVQTISFRSLSLSPSLVYLFTMTLRGTELFFALLGLLLILRFSFFGLKEVLMKNNKEYNKR